MHNYIGYLKNFCPSHVSEYDVYAYDKSDMQFIYQSYFDFCVENLNKSWDEFNIKPCYFYFKNDKKFNACATKYQDNTKIIEINYGLFEGLFSVFEKNVNYFDSISEGKQIWAVRNEPLCYLMFQTSAMFLYYHELGHILQFSSKIRKNFNEKYNLNSLNDYSFDSHVLEIDSDEFSANYVMEQIFYYFNRVVVLV